MLRFLWFIFVELQSSHRRTNKFFKYSNNFRSNVIPSKRFFSTSYRSQGKGPKSRSEDSFRKTLSSTESRPPLIITGFVDAEGSFSVFLYKRSKGEGVDTWYVTLCFSISLHKKDRAILEMIKAHFNGVVNINTKGKDAVKYRIQSLTYISLVINHFDLHPLYSQKQVDYTIFKQIFEMVKNKEHLNKEGLEKIVMLRSSLNWGLSDKLQGVERSLDIYRNSDEHLVKKFDIEIPIEILREIINPKQGDFMLYLDYILDKLQLEKLSKALVINIQPDFDLYYYVLNCTGLYDW